MRTIYTVIGNKMRAMRIPAKEAKLRHNDKQLSALVPNRKARRQDQKTDKGEEIVKNLATRDVAKSLHQERMLEKKENTPELGEEPMQLVSQAKANAALKAETSNGVLIIQPTRTEQMLNDVNSIASSLNA